MNYLVYEHQPGDAKCRVVSLRTSNLPQFKEFGPGDKVSYTAENSVVEVMDTAGNTRLEYNCEKVPITIHREGEKMFFSDRLPRERLWIRFKDGTGIAYKVPNQLEIKEKYAYILIPAGSRKVELFGDKYLSEAYELMDK